MFYKKMIGCLLMCFFMLFAYGCGQDNTISDGTDEELQKPEYMTNDLTQAQTIKDDNADIIDGYERFVLNKELGEVGVVYIPYVENRVRGVTYFYDDMREGYDYKTYAAINRPTGTSTKNVTANEFYESFSTQPEFSSKPIKTNPLSFILEGYNLYSPDEKEYRMTSMDVRAVSIALYEDFYEDIPQLTVKIYGISPGLWKEYVGDASTSYTYVNSAYENMLNICEETDYSNCTLLTSSNIDKTGVYYIDFKELSEMGDFVQYIVEFEFSYSTNYTYCVWGEGTYTVTSETEYQAWKQEHIEQFLNR